MIGLTAVISAASRATRRVLRAVAAQYTAHTVTVPNSADSERSA